MKPYGRAERVGGLIQQALSEILTKSIKDPRLKSVSITGVKMTADLKLARIYFITSGHFSNREEASAGFAKARGYIRNTLAQVLELRHMPELKFFYDESIEYAVHIENVIKRLHNENESDYPTTEEQ
ncbi:MAG: 30S ribosome-binding factor RbfA [Desulfobacteraceae bacterium]|nr:30S ribosome-binding factor RbfA [Desulfobacteraceae bacterium]MCF8095420.1 30S ribosome-binding factor RbfA [Desulfobacteraceae bacterium]